jgi:hypothetical protein
MQDARQSIDNEATDAAGITSPFGGRRRGDAILIAFNHAYSRGDIEVAAQLFTEYQQLHAASPLLLTVDRRMHDDSFAISHLWERLRRKFFS